MRASSFPMAGMLSTFVAGALAACATDREGAMLDPDADGATPALEAGAALDGGEAGTCADCEYFPEACADDVLCPNELFTSGRIDSRTQINVIRGRSASDVWLAGALGALAHFDGTSWTTSDVGARETLRALWLRDGAELSFVALGQFFGRGIGVPDDGGASTDGWAPDRSSPPPAEYSGWGRPLASAWAAPGAEWLWGATDNICTAFQCLISPKVGSSGLWRLHLARSGRFEIGAGIPADVCMSISCGGMLSVHGSSANDLWAVGATGATVHITNGESASPTVRTFNSQTWNALYGVWAASESDVWAVGAQGVVRHYTGAPLAWDVVSDVPTARDLRGVWGTSSSDVWIVGADATVFHYDGATWTRVRIAGLGSQRPTLTSVWGAAPGHVWIGGQGVLLSLGGQP